MTTRKLTRQEVTKRIIKAMGEGLFTGGLEDSAAVKKQVKAIIAKPAHSIPQEAFAPIMAHFLYTALGRRFKGTKTFTEEELQPILAEVRKIAEDLAPRMRKGLDDMKKRIIRRGGPGRREALSHTEKIDAIEQISTMVKTKAMNLPDVFEAVAETCRGKGKKVSARTIKRIWEKRKQLYEPR